MSNFDTLKKQIPKIIVGSIKYSDYNRIPEEHPVKNRDALFQILKRSITAGSEGVVFYLYNEEFVEVLNLFHKENPKIVKMLILKYEKLDYLVNLLEGLKFRPKVIFLDFSITDQKDISLLEKYSSNISKYTENVGIYTIEPIGTVSIYITSIPEIRVYLFPFNMLGIGLQNRSMLEMIVNSTENIYVTSNPLADSRLKPQQAFNYIGTHKVHGTLIDLEEADVMLETVKFAKYYFETHDFLQIALEFEDLTEICENCGLGMHRYYPPTGGSWFFCPQCQIKKERK